MDNVTKKTIQRIRAKFAGKNTATVPAQRGAFFTARLRENGIDVSNLNNLPFLPWAVFGETVKFLVAQGGVAPRGDAMKDRLGEEKLPLDSVEGHIASVLYGIKPGHWAFRRITPIAAILVWAGICENRRAALALKKTKV